MCGQEAAEPQACNTAVAGRRPRTEKLGGGAGLGLVQARTQSAGEGLRAESESHQPGRGSSRPTDGWKEETGV